MIRKLKSGEYRLYSRKADPKTGKRRNLGTFDTREAAAAPGVIRILTHENAPRLGPKDTEQAPPRANQRERASKPPRAVLRPHAREALQQQRVVLLIRRVLSREPG